MSTYNSTNSASVNANSLDFYYKTKNFIDTLAPQSECYKTLKAYVKTMWLERKHQWARNYTSKQTNLHKDTISAHNMIIEANGIFKIERAFKKNNIFSTKYLFVLAVLFGYLESASLFTSQINISHSSNNEETTISITQQENFPKKGIPQDISQILSKFTGLRPSTTTSMPKCTVSTIRKPYKNEILYCQNQYNKHNMNLLFNNTDVAADAPFGTKMRYKNPEERLAEIKRQTVPQSESNIWRNPLNNQQPWFKKEPKHYTEVEHFQHQCIYKEAYEKAKHDPRFSFMQDSLEVLKKIMESEKKK